MIRKTIHSELFAQSKSQTMLVKAVNKRGVKLTTPQLSRFLKSKTDGINIPVLEAIFDELGLEIVKKSE